MKPASSAALPSPPLGLNEVLLAARRVTAQGEDVLDPDRLDPVEGRREALAGLADAAQVRHHLERELILQRLRDLDRALAGRAAGAVGDGGEVEPQLVQRASGGEEPRPRLVRLRREELDREGRPALGDDLVDAHSGSVASEAHLPIHAAAPARMVQTNPPH
jgi:hypothetical protein